MPNYILIVYIFLGKERAELKSMLLTSYCKKKSEIAATFVPVNVSIIACAPHRSQGRRCVFLSSLNHQSVAEATCR